MEGKKDFEAPKGGTRWSKQGYQVVRIEGHGDKEKYWRLCDSIVRNSRLFATVFKKMKVKAQSASRNQNLREEYKRRLAENQRELKDFIAFSNKTIGALEKQIEMIKKERDIARKGRDTQKNNWRKELDLKKKQVAKNAKLIVENNVVKKHDRFFTTPLSFKNLYLESVKAELIVRGLVTFREYEQAGKIDFNEFLVFASGLHIKAFNKQDILNRHGEKVSFHFNKIIKKHTDTGYISKLHRKDLYYITETGKDFFEGIVRATMRRKMNTYYGGLFDDIKITKGNVSGTTQPKA